jgi:hypothetical protein
MHLHQHTIVDTQVSVKKKNKQIHKKKLTVHRKKKLTPKYANTLTDYVK